MRNAIVIGLLLAATVPLSSVHAAPAVPPVPTPGAVQATLPKAPAPKPSQTPSITSPATAAPSIAPGGVAVTVKQFEITGNTVFDEATLQQQISLYVGQSLTLADLYKVADVLTRFYQAHDYGLARVTVPEQKFNGGTAKLQVIEGTIGQVTVQGNTRTHSNVVLKRAASLQPGAVFTNQAAERAILLVNDLPGVQARGVMVPGSSFGTSDMVLNLKETPYQGYASIDDYGRPSIGRWRVNAGANVNSLTGHGDRLAADITHSDGNLLNFGNVTYSLPVGPSGGQLAATYNRAVYHVGGSTFGPLGISGSTNNASALYQYPAWRTASRSLFWGAGVLHTSSHANVANTSTTSNSLNLLQATVYYIHQHKDGSYYTLDGQAYTNGKSNDGSASNNGEKLRILFDSTYVKPLWTNWRLIGKGGLQWSPDPLVDNDKYSLGGPYNIRGFLPAEQRGDKGLFASGELLRSLPTVLGTQMALGGFLDTGKVWNLAHQSVPSNSQSLTSVGVDWQVAPASTARLNWNLQLQLAWAVGGYRPSDDTPTRSVHNADRGPHIWLSFGTQF